MHAVIRIILDRRYWALPLAVWTAVVVASLAWNLHDLERHAYDMALNRAQFIFKMVESVRLWNARHGGVYAPSDDRTPPNRYLEMPERDLVTPSGRRLTMINPAYMTRQLAAVLAELSDNRVHLTSLKPINPSNAPADWERTMLAAFERGAGQQHEIAGKGEEAVFRFMAPLRADKPCLKCHSKQGYREGDIRGGVSVSFAVAPLFASTVAHRHNLVAIHLGVWLLLSALTLIALHHFRRQMLSLQAANERQEQVVQERTARLRQEVREREQAEAQLRLFIESSGEGIYAVDMDARCTMINRQALELLGYADASEVLGKRIHEVIHHSDKDGKPLAADDCRMLATLRDGRAVHSDGEVFWRADGTCFSVECRSHPIFHDGKLLGAVVTFANITERKRQQDQIWHRAHHDALTGLPNRVLFRQRLDQAMASARNGRQTLALLYIDLDGFKEVNDRMGHDAGDLLLRQVAERLHGGVRDTDAVARLAGDEFAVILSPVAGRDGVAAVAAKLLEALAWPYPVKGSEVGLSASLGIALFPDDAADAEALVQQADAAMYEAKRAGRNTFRFRS